MAALTSLEPSYAIFARPLPKNVVEVASITNTTVTEEVAAKVWSKSENSFDHRFYKKKTTLCPKCRKIFKIGFLRTHLIVGHRIPKEEANGITREASKVFDCGLCSEKFNTPKKLVTHAKMSHELNEAAFVHHNFRVVTPTAYERYYCVVSGCLSDLQDFRSLRLHLLKKHYLPEEEVDSLLKTAKAVQTLKPGRKQVFTLVAITPKRASDEGLPPSKRRVEEVVEE